jgi:carbonic anhydrase
VQWVVFRDVVDVSKSQIRQIQNTSGFDNNFRDPMPLHGRIVHDGSDIVNSSFKWDVTVCCIEDEDVIGITRSVGIVLGISAEDIEIISFLGYGDRKFGIQYFIDIENTKSFETYLLKNLKDKKFLQKIKARIEDDSSKITLRTFESVSIQKSSWHYPYNVTEWGKVSKTCEHGLMQSPIDLPALYGAKQSKLNTTVGLATKLTASHKHSLQWSLNTTDSPIFYFNGLKYELLQWHCHTGSEHTVDGFQYPGECHFVHYFNRTSGSKYAVIGVFLNDNATEQNSAFSKLLDDLPPTDDWDEQELNINFDWSSIISGVNPEHYWAYSGSFTTPGCDENVQWIVLRDVVEVSKSQIRKFQDTSGFDNNFRDPMPLHGRIVQDGSDIVNSSFKWDVTVCCIEEGDLNRMTSSVGIVLGLSAENIEINSFSTHGDST